MHGIIFQQLQQFVTKTYGPFQWYELLDSVNLKGRIYMPTQVYPDYEAAAIIARASEISQTPAPLILEAFGEFMAPSLVKIYSASIKPEWNTIDLLEHVENAIHKAVRFADKNASPPELICERKSKSKVTINYSSGRRMIEVGIGIIKAIAKLKNETVDVLRMDVDGTTKLEVSLREN